MSETPLAIGKFTAQVRVEELPASRQIVAVERMPDGAWRVCGNGETNDEGSATVNIEVNPSSLVYAIAVDGWGVEWEPEMEVTQGDLIRPTSFAGWMYKVTQSGVLPEEQPEWWNSAGVGPKEVGTAMLEAVRYYQPIAHGPITVQLEEIGYDPYWEQVVALLHFDEDNGSTNPEDETRRQWTAHSGAVTRTTDKKLGTGSMDLTAAGSYLSTPYSASLNLSSTSFTIEFFLKVPALLGTQTLLDFRGEESANSGWALLLTDSGGLTIYDGTTNSYPLTVATSTISTDTWHHIALVRSAGGDAQILVDGTRRSLASVALPDTSQTGVRVGLGSEGANKFTGYLDELRITKGVARYTGTFSVPEKPFYHPTDEHWDKVVSLLHFDGAVTDDKGLAWSDVGVTFPDNSGVFGGRSAFFNGSADITSPSDPKLQLGTSDFTIEAFIKRSAGSTYTCLVDNRLSSGAGNVGIAAYPAGHAPTNSPSVWGNTKLITAGNQPIPENAWIHYAVTRESGLVRQFVGGILVSSGEDARNLTGGIFKIGRSSAVAQPYYGFVDQFRITKDLARYTEDFTPPAGRLPFRPVYKPFDPYWDKVVALLHFEEGLTDEKGGSWGVYLSGFIDNGFSRFGSGSLSTTARGGAVGGTEQVDTTDSFTLEGWVYITDLAPLNIIYSSRHLGADKRSSSLHVSGGTLGFQIFSSSGALQQSMGAAFSALEWTHVAVTYEKSTNLLRLFQNGVKTCEEPVSSGWVAQNPRYLAAWPNTDQPTRYLRGHLDEWRETKGIARYTENFTPPAAPFPNIGPPETIDPYWDKVVSLLHFEEGLTDETGKTWSLGSASVLNTETPIFGTGSLETTGLGEGVYTSNPINDSSAAFCIETFMEIVTLPSPTNGYGATDWIAVWGQTNNTANGEMGLWFQGNSIFLELRATGGGANSAPLSTPLTTGVRYHLAHTYDGTTHRVFLNGELVVSKAHSTGWGNTSEPFRIGQMHIPKYSQYRAGGYCLFDSFRITKGVARYTKNFDPPNAPFPTSGLPAV